MQIAKWGNSLAVRLPAGLVKELELKEGDDIEIVAQGAHRLEVRRDPAREQALSRLRELRGAVPAGFVFDREDAHGR